MRIIIAAFVIAATATMASAQLSDNQRAVLRDYVQRSNPAAVVAFIESSRQQQTATLKAYAAARRDELQANRDMIAATLAEGAAKQAERDAEIAKYDDVKQ